MLELIRKAFNRSEKPKETKAHKFASISENLFESTVRVRVSRRLTSQSVSYNDSRLTLKDLRNEPKDVQLRVLARVSPEFSKAINIYQSLTNTQTTLKTESNSAEQIIQDYAMGQEQMGLNEETQINENIRDLLIWGYFAMQNLGDANKRIIGIRNISPELLAFETIDSKLHTTVDAIGYYATRTNIGLKSNEFIPLESIEHKEPNFYYGSINTTSESRKGNPLFESAINLAISAGEKDHLINEWMRGQVSPNEIYFVNISEYLPLVAGGHVRYDDIRKLAKDAVVKVDNSFDNRDATQILTLDVPVEKVTSGTLQHRLAGLDSVNETYDVSFPRALHVPQSIFGAKRTGSALNDTQALHEILAFYKNVLLFRRTISRGRTKLYKAKLEQSGNFDKLEHGFSDADPEIKQIINEALLREVEAARTLIEKGVFTISEIREAFVSGRLDLTMFPPEHPDPEGAMRQAMERKDTHEQRTTTPSD